MGDSPNSKVFPSGFLGKAQQKAFKELKDEIVDEGNHKIAELVGTLRDFSMPRMLPLSGHKISLHDVDKDARQWHIKAKSFGENPTKDFPEIRDFYSQLLEGHLGLTEMGVRIERYIGLSCWPI